MPNPLRVSLTLEQTVEEIYNTALWNGKKKPFFFVTGAGVSAGIGGVPLSHDMIEVCRRSLSEETERDVERRLTATSQEPKLANRYARRQIPSDSGTRHSNKSSNDARHHKEAIGSGAGVFEPMPAHPLVPGGAG